MPLSATIAGDIFARAVRALTDRSGEHRPYQLALRINAQLSINPESQGFSSEQSLFTAVWNTVKQAAAAQAAGALVTPDNTRTPTPPKIPGIDPDQPNLRYRAIVTVTGPDGRPVKTAIDLREDTPQSYSTLRTRAGEIVANLTPREGDTPGRRRIAQMTDYAVSDVIIILAGRRD